VNHTYYTLQDNPRASCTIVLYKNVDDLFQWISDNNLAAPVAYLKQQIENKAKCLHCKLSDPVQTDLLAINIDASAHQLNKHTIAAKLEAADITSSEFLLVGGQVDSSDEDQSRYACKTVAAALGIWAHDGKLYKKDKGNHVRSINKLDYQGSIDTSDDLMAGSKMASSIGKVMDLVNAPSNRKTPVDMAAWMKQSSQEHGYKLTIMEMDELKAKGFHALLAVNRGSEIGAKCLIAEYRPKGATTHVVLVGKGVTFDTGGISIKGASNMHYMKSDMGGAAAVMGTTDLAASLGIRINITMIVPTTANSVDGLSINPGDIIDSYSGKTIEVINTDAEGRLILADALAYAVDKYPCDHLVDLATLTGSVVRALGTETSGFMTHDDELARSMKRAGEACGERTWRLPLWKEYHSYMESDLADISNLANKPMAGAITAGKFLEFFTEEHSSWLHIDIAATAFGKMPGYKDYAATGYGVDLLCTWLQTLENS